MEELKVFNYEENEIRTVQKDSETWWVLKDICEVLEIKNATDIAKRLDNDEVTRFNLGGQSGESNIINESGLYNVILRSDKPQAKPFRKWITSEVLPSIRKNGGYIAGQEELKPEEIVARALIVANNIIETQKKELEEKTKTLNILTHTKKLFTTTEIAKEMGMKSAIALNGELCKRRIQFRQNGTYVLYSKYSDLGYESIKQEVLDNGRVIYHRKWTQRGREFLLTTLAV